MAFGTGTINSIARAASDLFAAEGHRYKAEGAGIEAKEYGLAAGYSRDQAKFQDTSNAIKQAQIDRQIMKTESGQQADIAAAGFSNSGTALDLMRDSASQGALTRAVATQQGVITEAGYEEQANSYDLMQQGALVAQKAENNAAMGSEISAGIKGIAAAASFFV